MRYFAYIDEKPQTSFIKNLFINKKFKNHEISKNINVYQLHYISYHDSINEMQHESHYVYEPFKLPKGMTREEGFKLVAQFDECYPEQYIDTYLDYYQITREELDAIFDKWANKEILHKINGRWVKKEEIY